MVAGTGVKVVVNAEPNIIQPTPPTAITAAAVMRGVLEAMKGCTDPQGEGMDLADVRRGPSAPYLEKQPEKIH